MNIMRLTMIQGKIIKWLLCFILILFTLPGDFWSGLGETFTLSYIIGQHNAVQAGIVVLCTLFLFTKSSEIAKDLYVSWAKNPVYIACGVLLLVFFYLLPDIPDFLLLKLVFALTGTFAVVFGRASKFPLVLSGICAFVILFPEFVQRYMGSGYAQSVIIPTKAIIDTLRLSLEVNGQFLSFPAAGGETMTLLLTGACAGPATMSVFVGIFILMLMDMPVTFKKAAMLFVIGVIGTWLQNILRVLIILGCGYGLGREALWAAHGWTIYVLFPIWYIVFAAIYFKQVRVVKA